MTEEQKESIDDHLHGCRVAAFQECLDKHFKEALRELKKHKPKLHQFTPSFAGLPDGIQFNDKDGHMVSANIRFQSGDDSPHSLALGWCMWQMTFVSELLCAHWQPEREVMRILHTLLELVRFSKSIGVESLSYCFNENEPELASMA